MLDLLHHSIRAWRNIFFKHLFVGNTKEFPSGGLKNFEAIYFFALLFVGVSSGHRFLNNILIVMLHGCKSNLIECFFTMFC
jgi:hypothetical protein